MTKPRLLILGFEPFSEAMYPHTRAVVESLQKEFQVTYEGTDPRGYPESILPGKCRFTLRPGRLMTNARRIAGIYRNRRRLQDHLRQLGREHSFDLLLAIDHSALHNLVQVFGNSKPLVLWSHDVLTPDHHFSNSVFVRRLIRQNASDIKDVKLIIIQSPERAAVLDSVLFSHRIPKYYLPVSFPDSPQAALVAAANAAKATVSDPVRLMLMGGSLRPRYGVIPLLDRLLTVPEPWSLLLQGQHVPYIDDYVAKGNGRIRFMPFAPKLEDMRDRLAGIDIGMIPFIPGSLNDFFVTHACGQLVEYLRLGIPVITLFSPDFARFLNETGCGIPLMTTDDLGAALRRIRNDYSAFSRRARQCFLQHFDLSRCTASLNAALLQVAGTSRQASP